MVTLSKDAGGSGTYEYLVSKNGQLDTVEISGDDFVVPDAGNYRKLELKALSTDTYTVNTKYGEKQRRGVVLRILDQDSPFYKELVRTSVPYEETARGLGPNTMIGQIFTAVRGGEYPDGEDIDDDFWASIIGGQLECNLSISEDGKWVNIVKDTIKAVRKPASRPASARKGNALIDEDDAAEDAA